MRHILIPSQNERTKLTLTSVPVDSLAPSTVLLNSLCWISFQSPLPVRSQKRCALWGGMERCPSHKTFSALVGHTCSSEHQLNYLVGTGGMKYDGRKRSFKMDQLNLKRILAWGTKKRECKANHFHLELFCYTYLNHGSHDRCLRSISRAISHTKGNLKEELLGR